MTETNKDLIGLCVYRFVKEGMDNEDLCLVERERSALMEKSYLVEHGSEEESRLSRQIRKMDQALRFDYKNVSRAKSWEEYQTRCAELPLKRAAAI